MGQAFIVRRSNNCSNIIKITEISHNTFDQIITIPLSYFTVDGYYTVMLKFTNSYQPDAVLPYTPICIFITFCLINGTIHFTSSYSDTFQFNSLLNSIVKCSYTTGDDCIKLNYYNASFAENFQVALSKSSLSEGICCYTEFSE